MIDLLILGQVHRRSAGSEAMKDVRRQGVRVGTLYPRDPVHYVGLAGHRLFIPGLSSVVEI